jgi:hypothetical protein
VMRTPATSRTVDFRIDDARVRGDAVVLALHGEVDCTPRRSSASGSRRRSTGTLPRPRRSLGRDLSGLDGARRARRRDEAPARNAEAASARRASSGRPATPGDNSPRPGARHRRDHGGRAAAVAPGSGRF